MAVGIVFLDSGTPSRRSSTARSGYSWPMDARQLETEGRAVQACIADAFANTTREGGVSWRESVVLDDYGSEEERVAARALDTERHWSELIDDPEALATHGSGGFSFLDALGFRYYLAVAMMQIARGQDDKQWIAWHLRLPVDESREYRFKIWSALDAPQRKCVTRFLRYMAAWGESKHAGWGDDWQEALDSYWEAHA